MKLLFITRKYPPMVGGMEKLSYALSKEFSKHVDTTLITWGKSQKYLPYFIPLALIKSLYIIPTKKIDHIHIGDALLSPLGLILKFIFHLKTTITIAGLDITFDFPGYQLLIPKCVAKFDKIICISNATLNECVKRGIPKDKCVIIPCGIYPEEYNIKANKNDLSKTIGIDLKNKQVIITVGRLVKRKGVYWFIENILPKLNNNIIYLIIGDGPDRNNIEKLTHASNLENRVFLLGKIPENELKIIYSAADIFIMPNIKVDNNIEGFGIVAIEASASGMPVIASDIEGISNAVINGKTGVLVESMNAKGFIKAIDQTDTFNKNQVSRTTKSTFSWESIGEQYIKYIS